jgi:hypothetical protein
MKILSAILTALLLIPVVICSIAIFQVYFQTSASPLISNGTSLSIAEPTILYGASYLVFFCLSILLNIRGKFKINVVLSGSLVLIFLVSINLLKRTWLG